MYWEMIKITLELTIIILYVTIPNRYIGINLRIAFAVCIVKRFTVLMLVLQLCYKFNEC